MKGCRLDNRASLFRRSFAASQEEDNCDYFLKISKSICLTIAFSNQKQKVVLLLL